MVVKLYSGTKKSQVPTTKYVQSNHVQLGKHKSVSEFKTFKQNGSETFILEQRKAE